MEKKEKVSFAFLFPIFSGWAPEKPSLSLLSLQRKTHRRITVQNHFVLVLTFRLLLLSEKNIPFWF